MAKKYQLHGAFPSKAGDSAYEVAQKNGFKGTEQEWLASLVGPQGPQGLPGEDGSSGSGVHVGTEEPTDPSINVWINPDGEASPDVGTPGKDGGYYTPEVTQPEAGKMQIDWTASQDGMPSVEPETIILPAGPAGKDGKDGEPGVDGVDGVDGKDYILTDTDKQEIAELAASMVDVPSGGGYTLPIATPDTLGGVKPVAKTEDMTQSVGVDEDGGLWAAPGVSGGGGVSWTTIYEGTLEEDVTQLHFTTDEPYLKIVMVISPYYVYSGVENETSTVANATKFAGFSNGRAIGAWVRSQTMMNNESMVFIATSENGIAEVSAAQRPAIDVMGSSLAIPTYYMPAIQINGVDAIKIDVASGYHLKAGAKITVRGLK